MANAKDVFLIKLLNLCIPLKACWFIQENNDLIDRWLITMTMELFS